MKKRIRIKKRVWVFLSILLLILLFNVNWPISDQNVRTVNLELRVVSTQFPVEVIFIRDEKIIRSPNMGQIFFGGLVEGERVRVNQQVAVVYNQTFEGTINQTAITTDSAGVLSFYIDGFEDLLSGRQMSELDLTEIINRDFAQYREYRSEGDIIAGGTPILRIINHFSDVNFILYFPQDYVIRHGFELSELEDNNILLKSDMDEYRISITSVGFSGKNIFGSGRVIGSGEDFYNIRKGRFTLVLDRLEGYLVAKEAIVYNAEGEPGIYIQIRMPPVSRYRWVSVDVLKTFPNEALIIFGNSRYPVVINPQVL